MTNEEAVMKIKARLECMTRNVSGMDCDCNAGRCVECRLNYGQGNMGEQIEYLRIAIKALEQEPKKGHWIKIPKYGKWICSECGTNFRFTFKEHDYCPNCGAKMVEPQERRDKE